MPGRLARPVAGGGQKNFLMIALNDVGASLFQARDDVVGKLILEDAVAEAQQFVDIAHRIERQVEALKIAMQVRNNSNFQQKSSR